ncbi:hypothetical protein [Streptomyces albidus (ex Kaewkla and Franco 2022)]|nr:hypothetical protein [Streptomyces albidus (ex Kaewkla and Franco 2022)]
MDMPWTKSFAVFFTLPSTEPVAKSLTWAFAWARVRNKPRPHRDSTG